MNTRPQDLDDYVTPATVSGVYLVALHADRQALESAPVHLALLQPITEALQHLVQAARARSRTEEREPHDAVPESEQHDSHSAPRGTIGTADTIKMPVAVSQNASVSQEHAGASQEEHEPHTEKVE